MRRAVPRVGSLHPCERAERGGGAGCGVGGGGEIRGRIWPRSRSCRASSG